MLQPAVGHMGIARRYAALIGIIELHNLVVLVTIIDLAALAEGIAIDDAPNVGVIVETTRILGGASP